jgi:hypothetical protein
MSIKFTAEFTLDTGFTGEFIGIFETQPGAKIKLSDYRHFMERQLRQRLIEDGYLSMDVVKFEIVKSEGVDHA